MFVAQVPDGLLKRVLRPATFQDDEEHRIESYPRTEPKESHMPYEVPPLPYDYNALEPHIDEATMKFTTTSTTRPTWTR